MKFFYTDARIQSLKEGHLQSGWARLALLSFVCMYCMCVFVCVYVVPFACLTKQKWISCVCQSSSRFTNNNNYFCIVKLHGSPGHFLGATGHEPVTPEHKSTNWNGGSISIVWRAVRPLRKLSRVQAEFSFFFHKKSDFNINLRFSKARYKKFEILLIGNLTSWKKWGPYRSLIKISYSHSRKYFSQSSSNLNKKIINQKILQDRNLEH